MGGFTLGSMDRSLLPVDPDSEKLARQVYETPTPCAQPQRAVVSNPNQNPPGARAQCNARLLHTRATQMRLRPWTERRPDHCVRASARPSGTLIAVPRISKPQAAGTGCRIGRCHGS